MKKITLEFTGDDYENGVVASKGTELWLALYDIKEDLRNIIKNSDEEEANVAEEILQSFLNILDYYSITLEELS